MILIDWINEHADNWQELIAAEPYFVKVKNDGDYYLLKYSQIDSPHDNWLTNQCRGVIVRYDDAANEWIVVCRPFNRFFNLGEEAAAVIHWEHELDVTEKLDGSLVKLWYDRGEWHWSTNGTIDAHKAKIGVEGIKSFGDIIDRVIARDGLDITRFDRDFTYLFELMSPVIDHVVKAEHDDLYLITAFHTYSGMEATATTRDVMSRLGFQVVPTLYYNSLDEILARRDLNDLGEGMVVKDYCGNRVKVKTDEYMRLHYLRGDGVASMSRLVDVVVNHEQAEFLAYMPTYAEQIKLIEDWIEDFTVSTIPAAIFREKDRKSYAIRGQQLFRYSIQFAYYMWLYDHSGTFEDYLRQSHSTAAFRKFMKERFEEHG